MATIRAARGQAREKEERRMKLTKAEARRGSGERVWVLALAVWALVMVLAVVHAVAAVTTVTVQGTVYLANGSVGSGTLYVSWPAFTTADGLAVVAGHTTATIGTDGFVSVNLAPNAGATPSGLFYTAVYTLSDGSTSTEYWVIPSAAQATISAVRAQVMPAAQAVQAVTKSYVDNLVAGLTGGGLSTVGGTLTGPLYLSEDPVQPMEASDKHYVDTAVVKAVPIAGGNMTGALTTPSMNSVVSPTSVSAVSTLQTAVTAAGTTGAVLIPPSYTGTDTFTNSNGVRVEDMRTAGAQPHERNVKEFGAVCDGATDDTTALQTALNYAYAKGVALVLPQGTCFTQALTWRGESIRGLGKAVSALKGFPGQDVLVSATDSTQIVSGTTVRDLTIYVDVSRDASCAPAAGRASAGSCAASRVIENNSIYSSGGSGLTSTTGTGAGWYVGNCAMAMPASTGAGGNGLKAATIENVRILATGTDPLVASYSGANSTHTCGLYLAQWPQWSVFRNLDIEGVATGVAMPALSATPSGLVADGNRWEQVTIKGVHGFTAADRARSARRARPAMAAAVAVSSTTGCAGAAGSSGAGGTSACVTVNAGPQGGSGGGGLISATTAAGGSQSAANVTPYLLFGPSAMALTGNSGGSAGGGSGSTPVISTAAAGANGYFLSALGGTGGGSNCTGAGGTGGAGMSPGGGGAGGGAACNGYSSGAGGAGGAGLVRIVVQ